MLPIKRSFSKIIVTICGVIFSLSATCAFAQSSGDNWYPQNISLPANHKYPCTLNPLPRDLTGITQSEKTYINHAFSLILKMLQAKIVMFDTVSWDNQDFKSAYSTYYANTVSARQKFMQLTPPKGLEGFGNEIINGLDKQIVFFQKASCMRESGKSSKDILQIPQGKEASALFMSAWGRIVTRYPQMSPAVKDSLYHHLCALDVF